MFRLQAIAYPKRLLSLGLAAFLSVAMTLVLFLGMYRLVDAGQEVLYVKTSQELRSFIRNPKPQANLDEKRQLPIKRAAPKTVPVHNLFEDESPREDLSLSGLWTAPSLPEPEIDSFQSDLRLQMVSQEQAATPFVRVDPIYPRRAAERGLEGWVDIEFDISKIGSVDSPRVLASQPPRTFDRAAIQAVRRWKYKAQIIKGKPVKKKGVRVRLEFSLEGLR
jgi:periplasmic protein TonB